MRKTLQSLYENMGTDPVIEEAKEPNNFSKFDLSDYTNIIYEGKSGHGDEKAVRELLKDAIKKELVTVKETSHGWIVKSNKDSNQETIHRGERAFRYL